MVELLSVPIVIFWNWPYIDLLFVKEELRGFGYGHRLLEITEDEARKRGATNVYLDTFSFQAPDFYKQHGYRVFGELKDFPPGHQRYFFYEATLENMGVNRTTSVSQKRPQTADSTSAAFPAKSRPCR